MNRAGGCEQARSRLGRSVPEVIGARSGRTIGDALKARFRDWEAGFATSSVAYLLREGAWSRSAWDTPRTRRRRVPAVAQVRLHLP